MEDDRLLVEAVLRGEVQAFGSLVQKYRAPLIMSACQMIGRREDAADLAQEALVAAYQSLGQLRDPRKFRPWLFSILRFKCLDYLRAHPDNVFPLETCAELPTSVPDPTAETITVALQRLPFSDREILSARYLYELDYDEIAQAYGITVRTARMRCLRARERLRAQLLADEEETRRVLQGLYTLLLLPNPTAGGFQEQVLAQTEKLPPPTPPLAPPAWSPPLVRLWALAHWRALAAGLICLGVGLTLAQFVTPHGKAMPSVWANTEADSAQPLLINTFGYCEKLLVTRDEKRLIAFCTNEAVVWDIASRRVEDRLPAIKEAHAVDISSDSRYLLAATRDSTMVWDLQRHALAQRWPVNSLSAFTANGRQIWLADYRKESDISVLADRHTLTLCDVSTGQPVRTLSKLLGRVLAISRDGRQAVSATGTPPNDAGHYPTELILWNLATGKEVRRFDNTQDPRFEYRPYYHFEAAISPGGDKFAIT
ncbi:MAG TPA: sigma-70 family RNA polymerase sigma factor, partial [Armatimonadota bacterium]